MTSPSLIGTPLVTDPFLELLSRTGAGDPGTPLGIYTKLATTPKKIKASRSLDKMALVTDLRAADIVALGTPSGGAEVPTGGIRVFNYNDRFLFLGANGVRDPIMYERSSLFYRDTDTIPDLPVAAEKADVACFSKGGRYFVCTFSSTPDKVQVYTWSSGDEFDPEGVWEHAEDPLVDEVADVTKLWVTPLNNYLVVQTGTRFRLYDVQGSLGEETASPVTGQLLAVNADETEWLIAPNDTSDIEAATFSGGVFTTIDTLPTSAGSQLKAFYSEDGDVIGVLGRPQTGTESPRFYCKDTGGLYVYASGQAHANAASWSTLDFALRPDGQQIAVASADASGSRVELYARDEIVPDPFTPDGTMTEAHTGIASRSEDGEFISLARNVLRWNGSGFTNVTPATYYVSSTDRSSHALSADGEFLIACSLSNVSFWRWNGSSYDALAGPIASPSNIRGVALSQSGLICAVFGAAGTSGSLRFFQYTVGTNSWAQIGTTFTFTINGSSNRMSFCPGRDDLMVFASQSLLPVVYKLDGGVFVLQPALPYVSGLTYGFPSAWSPDGNYLATAVRDASLNWRLNVFFRGGGDSFTLAYSSPANVTTSLVAQALAYSVDGKYLLWVHNDSVDNYYLWRIDGITFTPATVPSEPAGGGQVGVWTTDRLLIGTSSTFARWVYDASGVLQTYTLETTFALTGTGLSSYLTYSPDGSVLHYGRSADSHHVYSVDPYSALTELSFASDRAASEVYNIVYSPTGKSVFFFTPDGPEIAVRPNIASDFLNAKDIEGCFVFLYDREGSNYVERGFSQHKYGSILRDLEFSENENVFCYHAVLPPDAAEDAARGRLMYDVSEASGVKRFEYRGAIWEEEMTDSLIAFSPWNTHFVVTHEHLDTSDHVITLHEFTTDYNFVTQDTKPVSFGPPDFSKCDDVVVAHGGIPQMTFFKHDDDADVLIPRPVDINWDFEGVILDVAFRDDCEGIVVLTPDELYPLEPDPEDPDSYEPEPPTELDDDVDDDTDDDDRPDLDVDDDDDIKVDPPDWEPPQDYDWDPDDDENPISSINYVPYTAVTVTFRVRSIPS